jgi:L-asparaginase
MSDQDKVLVISLGGTISMRVADGALHPALGASELVDGRDSAGADATVSFETLATLPGASLTDDIVVSCAQRARAAVADGFAGVVVATGTDTLEQVAYFFDLVWDLSAPLVVTGAMRGSDARGAEGPANLHDAILVAKAHDAMARGVLVVLNEEIHAAAEVSKGHTLATHAFGSRNFGPIGRMVESRPVFFCDYRRIPPGEAFAGCLDALAARPSVAIVACSPGANGAWIEGLSASGIDGLVVCAFGVGHVPETWVPALRTLSLRMPIVYASSVASGPVVTSTYGFTGSERSLIELGAIPSGFLSPQKAQVLLSCLLALGLDALAMKREFGMRGRWIPSDDFRARRAS